ncbi:hypothetical protein [Acidianus brierleyi]|uniref:Uncharacterized protein n=1 Tax=Acidianus brierleyi TaxID=41673 RepID=A0A2U9IBW3_9CREN|nr:hypothetical protein [Acidianus brierleyi]AWR93483.1 hypothetical protein DFR85_01510 [Acidianus brierleyi]
MSVLQVYSNPAKAVISCSLVDENGNEKEILTITLEDNGIHVHKNIEKDDHYIIPPIPQIDMLIREVIEQIAEELNVQTVVFRYGENSDLEETDDLILSDAWYDIEKLALAASKHAALANDVESKVIIGIVKFSNFIYAATVLRKEDTFPLLQIFMDSSNNEIKIYNEIGQLVEERREKVQDFEEYVKSLVNSSDVAVVYKESLDEIPSPKEITTDNGRYYVGVVFKYFMGFFPSSSIKEVSSKRIYVRNKSKFVKLLRALLYLDKLSDDGGVEVLLSSSAVPLNDIPKEVDKIKGKVDKILGKYKITDVNYFGINDTLIKELVNYKPQFGEGDVYLGMRVIPVAFVIITENKQDFDNYVERILNGPTSDGYEILDEAVKKYISSYFIGYLMSVEEALIIYSDIFNELSKDDK